MFKRIALTRLVLLLIAGGTLLFVTGGLFFNSTTTSAKGTSKPAAKMVSNAVKAKKPTRVAKAPTPTSAPVNASTPVAASPSPEPVASSGSMLNFPADFGMDDVKVKYGARGDGQTDDTAALQKALADGREEQTDYFGRPKSLYFPAGTYLVSDTLQWNGCCMTLQGQGSGSSIIKLKDQAAGFNDANAPKAVIVTPNGNTSFRQNIWNLGVNTGSGNAGAIGLDYISNNTGSLNDVAITSGDGSGDSGLNMTRAWPGPCYIENVQVTGFNYGIQVGQPEYGPTFEHISLQNQRIAGFANSDNVVAIRDLKSVNTVPALQNRTGRGSVMLIDATLTGGTSASAIENSGDFYARNVKTSGYEAAISTNGTAVAGTSLDEYTSNKTYSVSGDAQGSLKLPIQDTPTFYDDNMANWAAFRPGSYGDTSQMQATLDSGKSTIYFPPGAYMFYARTVVTVPATVRRIIGFSSVINSGDGGGLVFKVADDSTQPLIIEQFAYGVSVEHDSARPVVIQHGSYGYQDTATSGDLYLNDTSNPLTLTHAHNVWARQLNTEEQDQTNITNDGATLWILGIKTEGASTVVKTTGGGKTEVLGTLLYPARVFSAAQSSQAAFINVDSQMSVIVGSSSYVDGGYYTIFYQKTSGGATQNILAKDMAGRAALVTG